MSQTHLLILQRLSRIKVSLARPKTCAPSHSQRIDLYYQSINRSALSKFKIDSNSCNRCLTAKTLILFFVEPVKIRAIFLSPTTLPYSRSLISKRRRAWINPFFYYRHVYTSKASSQVFRCTKFLFWCSLTYKNILKLHKSELPHWSRKIPLSQSVKQRARPIGTLQFRHNKKSCDHQAYDKFTLVIF